MDRTFDLDGLMPKTKGHSDRRAILIRNHSYGVGSTGDSSRKTKGSQSMTLSELIDGYKGPMPGEIDALGESLGRELW